MGRPRAAARPAMGARAWQQHTRPSSRHLCTPCCKQQAPPFLPPWNVTRLPQPQRRRLRTSSSLARCGPAVGQQHTAANTKKGHSGHTACCTGRTHPHTLEASSLTLHSSAAQALEAAQAPHKPNSPLPSHPSMPTCRSAAATTAHANQTRPIEQAWQAGGHRDRATQEWTKATTD